MYHPNAEFVVVTMKLCSIFCVVAPSLRRQNIKRGMMLLGGSFIGRCARNMGNCEEQLTSTDSRPTVGRQVTDNSSRNSSNHNSNIESVPTAWQPSTSGTQQSCESLEKIAAAWPMLSGCRVVLGAPLEISWP